MNADKATALMVKLAESGSTYDEIAKTLKEKGYKSERTGKPLTPLSIGQRVRQAKANPTEGESSQAPVEGTDDAENRCHLVAEILSSTMAAEKKCQIMLKILEA